MQYICVTYDILPKIPEFRTDKSTYPPSLHSYSPKPLSFGCVSVEFPYKEPEVLLCERLEIKAIMISGDLSSLEGYLVACSVSNVQFQKITMAPPRKVNGNF